MAVLHSLTTRPVWELEILEHLPALQRYAFGLARNFHTAEDLVQDTIVKAYSYVDKFQQGSNLRAWLFTLMHNLFASQVRSSVRRARAGREVDLDDVADELASPAPPPDLALDLQRCLMRLPEDQRAVLLLVTLEDLQYADVARILKVPVGTVMSRLSRARSRLRELMEGAPLQQDRAGAGAARVPPQPPHLKRLK